MKSCLIICPEDERTSIEQYLISRGFIDILFTEDYSSAELIYPLKKFDLVFVFERPVPYYRSQIWWSIRNWGIRFISDKVPIIIISEYINKSEIEKSYEKVRVIDKIVNYKIDKYKNLDIVLDDLNVDYSNFFMNCLIADDNTFHQEGFPVFYDAANITTDVATNGEEAFHLFKKNKYDFIHMDVQMPVMNGIEAAEKIRDFEKEQNIKPTPIFFYQSNFSSESKFNLLKFRPMGYLAKPFCINQVFRMLRLNEMI
jgi:CheY-like chemotaxis protein